MSETDDLKADYDNVKMMFSALQKNAAEFEDQAKTLIVRTRGYAVHLADCTQGATTFDAKGKDCSCGLTALDDQIEALLRPEKS